MEAAGKRRPYVFLVVFETEMGWAPATLPLIPQIASFEIFSKTHSSAMNVIRQTRGNPAGGPRPLIGPLKSKGRGRGVLDFDPIQFRPGQRASSSTDSGDTRTPSNWQLQRAISSSACRTSSSSIHTTCGNATTPSPYSHSHQLVGNQQLQRSGKLASSSSITPTSFLMPPPKTPRCNTSTPKNSIIVSSTPRTTPSVSSGTDNQNSHVVLALTEGRGHARGEVGIAVIDIKRPRLILCQLSDRQTYANTLTKITIFRPVEILIPHTFVDSSQPNKLYSLLEEKFPMTNMTKVQRRLFRDSEGLEKVQNLCLPENSSCQLVIQDRFYALAAAAALLKYVEFVQNVIFAAHSLKVEYQGAHDGTLIDIKTAKNLELLLNQQSNNATHTLIGILDHCCTHGGSRLLRASLLHPPCSLTIITNRQDGVQELAENLEITQKLQEILKQLPDVEQLLTLCMLTPSTFDGTQSMEKRINYVLMLKTTLEILPHLAAALENSQSTMLCKARESLKDSRGDLMKERILETLHEDVKAPKGGKTALFQKCFAVKSGVDELMDVARKTYCELINDIHDHVLDMGTTHSLPLKIDYSVTKGYHIQITFQKNQRIEKSNLPPFFVQVQQSRNCLTCTTDTLIHANERIKHVTSDILGISNRLLTTVLNDIRQHISYLYEMCESIAVVDILLALARTASCNNYVRPTFGDHLLLKSSRHPILESFATCDPVANDIEATSWKNLCIITGPNMSGKSIYLRQVLLLQIMAQVGSFVPAEQAVFRITDHIFSHLNFDDSIENNASTLSLEMQEMQFILSNITPTSIIALDELCRGTSVEEGTAIAWALCEELSQSAAFVFVTTHFAELTKLASLYPCVKNVYLETVETEYSDKKSRLVYTHRLLSGVNPMEHYGLKLAENMDVPKAILEMASNLSSKIKATTEVNLASADGNEAYTLSVFLHKLKILIDEDNFRGCELLKVQEKLKQALELVEQKRNFMSSCQKTSLVPQEPQAHNKVSLPDEQLQRLCDYSSSDCSVPEVTSNKPNMIQMEHKKLQVLQEDMRFTDVDLSESPQSSKFPFNRTYFNVDPPNNSISLSSTRSDVSDDGDEDDNNSIVSSSSTREYNDAESNRTSPTSYCSYDTWLARSPTLSTNQERRISNNSLRRENSKKINSSIASDCNTYDFERSFQRSDENFPDNSENLSVPNFIDGASKNTNHSLFGTTSPEKSIHKILPNPSGSNFFSSQGKSSISSNAFTFSQDSPNSQSKFNSLFPSTPEFKRTPPTTSPLSSFVFKDKTSLPSPPATLQRGMKRTSGDEKDKFSPLFNSIKYKRKAVLTRHKPPSANNDVPLESDKPLEDDETLSVSQQSESSDDLLSGSSSCLQAPPTPIGSQRNSLQILMESYNSDSDSD
ncbi:MutS protein-like protein 4 [Frankliniella fusca]|uniref:MutS protein-like protein 4 n=1 Tax=Frankliniella fusca TaxID=407009 RepID=A0AAE1HAN5_9NEOP|nr:MutS protein-like protein 4 [Frankliniella fusca]